MNIAVLFGEVGYISHKIMMDGITALAYRRKANVFLFTCEGWRYSGDSVYEEGEYNIYNLPDLSSFDGVIVDLDSIHDAKAHKAIIDKLMNSTTPCVSINRRINRERSATISLENYRGIKSTVEHLVKVHGARRFHFISGPNNNVDAVERREAFINAVAKYNIEFGTDDISYGDFQYQSGQKVIERYLKKKRPLPDAFVAANDYMAIGAMKALQKAGYNIPKDVMVVGYDNCPMASYVRPRLSTVVRDEFKAGKDAFRAIEKLISGESVDKPITIKGINIFAESCGCHYDKKLHRDQIIMDLSEEKIYTENTLETLKATTIDFSNISSFSEFSMKFQSYIEQYNYDYFYLVICGSRDSYFEEIDIVAAGKEPDRNHKTYTKTGSIPLAYEKGQWNSYMDFELSRILPDECQMKRDGEYYIVVPVHDGEYCIGYCVIGNSNKRLKQRFIPHLIIDINSALGNIREKDIMHTMFAKINERWIYDDLTGIYNRAGLWQKSEEYIKKAANDNKKVAVFFIDLDGLKRINDEFGHDEGDSYIKSMADILVKLDGDSDIVARYGGDEYIVLSSYSSNSDIDSKIARIEEAIYSFNNGDVAHKLSASIGYQKEDDFEEIDIRKMIALADKEMYLNKRIKNRKRR